MRVGHGYDVHRLVIGRDLILGGVKINYSKGLLGHSDADVLLHSIMDALLGAAGLGDIGKHFPDTSFEYKDASSLILLSEVCVKIKEKGYAICNIDSTIIAQEPKLSDYILKMKENISKACGIPGDLLNVKATTEERLGFTGSLEGIASHSVCIIDSL